MTISTKTIALALAGVLAAGAFTHGAATPAPTPEIVEGAGKPILLARMVVTADALPAE